MKTRALVLKAVSYTGLVLTLIPSLLVFAGTLDVAMYKTLMMAGTGCWLVSAPFWINYNG